MSNFNRTLLQAKLALLTTLAITISGITSAQTIETTGFEGISSFNFTVGTSPVSASFIGGQSQTIGNASFYRSGRFSWHILPASTAMVIFESPAQTVSFWFRRGNGRAEIVARVIDTNGEVIQQDVGSTTFISVQVSRASTDTPIARVEFLNDGDSDSVVDDFEFSAVPDSTVPDTPDTTAAPGLADPIPEVISGGAVSVALSPLITALNAPLHATSAPNHPDVLYVADQSGQIHAVDIDTGNDALFLDISSSLVPLGFFGAGTFDERGLLGFAFHPEYAANGLVYTYTSEAINAAADFTTLPNGTTADHQSVVNEWQVTNPSDPFTRVDLTTRREVIRLDQPQFNHNGGALAFDTDNLLYIALGDGGGADDQDGQNFFGITQVGHGSGNAQDRTNPFGSILRIDPNDRTAANGNYGVPASNPFVGIPGVLPEIYAYGFRNPFSMSFDEQTGDLWVADVGQNDIEEVNQVVAGGNYGWNILEGTFSFNDNGFDEGFVTDDSVAEIQAVDPVAQYDHDEGLAIIGGFVYRGTEIPSLVGHYVFGDFGQFGGEGGRLFYLDDQNTIRELLPDGQPLNATVNGFGQDSNGELYVLTNQTGTPFDNTGSVSRLTSADSNSGQDNTNAPRTDTTTSSGGGGLSPVLFAFAMMGLMLKMLVGRAGSSVTSFSKPQSSEHGPALGAFGITPGIGLPAVLRSFMTHSGLPGRGSHGLVTDPQHPDPLLYFIELKPNRFPSVSMHTLTKPYLPIDIFGLITWPPAPATLDSSTAQSSTPK